MRWHYDGDEVKKEKWCWVARYNDGTHLSQFDNQGVFHRFAEIRQEKLVAFEMTDGKISHALVFPDGAKLIHFYRNIKTVINDEQSTVVHSRLYCYGYEANGLKIINVILSDGRIMTVDDIDKIKLL